MEWIKIETGISPTQNVIVVYRENGSYELAYKFADKYTSSDNRDINRHIIDGDRITYFIDLPPVSNKRDK